MRRTKTRWTAAAAALVLLVSAWTMAAGASGLGEWHSYRGSSHNIAVTGAKTPRNAGEARLDWMLALKDADDWMTNVSDPILVGGVLYVAVGDALWAVDADGQVLRKIPLADAVDYTCRMVYADGMIAVPLPQGRLQAIELESGNSLWVTDALPDYTDPGTGYAYAHQSQTTLLYEDGYVYLGTACADWTASYYGVYQCVELSTGNVVWQYDNDGAGYYWSGAVLVNGVLVFAGDDGLLTALDPADGSLLGQADLGAPVRATAVQDGGHAYLVSTDGVLHRAAVNPDGTFGTVDSVSFAASSTSTPAVYGGKAYVAGDQGAANGYQGIVGVVDLAAMAVEQSVCAPADVKSAPLISTGYDGAVYAYFTANTEPGGIYVLELGGAQAEAVAVYEPEGDAANYCMASVLADDAGTLYYTNDSGNLFAVSAAAEEERPAGNEEETTAQMDETTTAAANGGGSGSSGGSIPKTGDQPLWFALAAAAGASGCLLAAARRREHSV